MSEYADDYCEVWSETSPVARKRHTCDACNGPITPGRRYHRTFSVFEGTADTVIRCERCQAIYEHLRAKMAVAGEPDECCNPTLSCGHEYKERWKVPPPEEIAALAFWLPGDPLPTVAR
jgi:RNase P subunit RPR2